MNRLLVRYKIFVFLVMSLLSLAVARTSSSQDFTATSFSDYGNVTVIEVTGDYRAKNADGSVNSAPREAIAREFFRTHKDEYDFLVIFSNFDFSMPDDGHAKAFYMGVKNDTQGLGLDQFNNTDTFGSTSGRLQGVVDMGNLSGLVTDPLNAKFEDTLYVLSHELMHRWGAHVKFKQADGNLSTALLGKDQDHWSFLLDSSGSVLYGNRWQDNGNGTFTSLLPQSETKFYSPLDLYLMGMTDKSKVPPMLLIENPDIDPARLPEAGVTISGTARTVTIDDIIAAVGERIPDTSTSQKSFKTAFIYITTPGTFNADAIYQIENVRNGFVTRHSILTDGQSIVEVASTPKEDVPVNPGVLPPSTIPRTLPADINQGVQWLMSNQKSDGSWSDVAETMERDTAEAVLALKTFSEAQTSYSSGLQWLANSSSGNMDYLSRKIEAFQASNQDVSGLVAELLSRRNTDGGWGSDRWYKSNSMDTAIAMKAMAVSGYGITSSEVQSVVAAAIQYLKAAQKPDGGWTGNGESTIQATSYVLSAFNKYRAAYQVDDVIARGVAWLLTKQNTDGGFGPSASSGQGSLSTVYDTALAVLALRELNASTEITNKGLEYLLAQQSESGSWNNSAYQTALAVGAVYKATVDPDLSIKSDDITIIPGTITILPSNIVINANISNLGQTGAQAKVVLYKDSVSDANKIGEQTLAFPGQSTTTVTFSATASDGSEHRFYMVVDPDNQVKESNDLNNTAVKVLYPEATYDFEILSSDITLSANPGEMFQDVKVTAKIMNKGTMNAYNVQVKYFIDDPATPFNIGTQTVDIPAGATISNDLAWRVTRVGVNMPLTVLVDSFDNFTEVSETNNKAYVPLTVNADTRPNPTVSYRDLLITPSPAHQSGTAHISALVKNEGFSAANNIVVNFYRGVPGPNALFLGTQAIAALSPGESVLAALDWANIPEAGEKIIYVQVDPGNAIPEMREDDNDAFTTLSILTLPDLSISSNSITFSPAAPKEGDPVTITVTVQNKGEQDASNVVVRLSESGTVLGDQSISSVAANSLSTISLSYDTTARKGVHTITATVDPHNSIAEQSKDDNSASRTLGVQDSNLWVTEQYISPNGDGVKDSTQFFFRLDAPQTVKVAVVNKNGKSVRSFNGNDFANIISGNVFWDGLNDNGTVVDDGQYQIQVLDAGDNIIAGLMVTVDNNRSPFLDAVGTKYLLTNDISRQFSSYFDYSWQWNNTWEWLPDESGILIRPVNGTGYPTNFYVVSNDGNSFASVIPQELNFKINGDHQLSPDGSKIAFTLYKNDGYPTYLDTSELWVVDQDGRNLRLLDSITGDHSAWGGIFGMEWSPDGEYISYQKVVINNGFELRIIKPDGSGNRRIDAVEIWPGPAKWSPDSGKIAGIVNGTVIAFDIATGIKHDAYTFNNPDRRNYFYWLDNVKIAVIEYDHSNNSYRIDEDAIRIIDLTNNNNTITLSQDIMASSNHELRNIISPDRKLIAFATLDNGILYLKVGDFEGHQYILKQFDHSTLNTGALSEYPCALAVNRSILWSPDSGKIVFDACEDEYWSDSVLVRNSNYTVVDIKTKEEVNFGGRNLYPMKWLNDSKSLICYQRWDFSYYTNITILINAETGEATILPIESGFYHEALSEDQLLSPIGNSIAILNTETWPGWYWNGGGWVYQQPQRHLSAIKSILNLTADLNAVKKESSLILQGNAADLNFEGYKLEYADVKNPAIWNNIVPSSDMSVVNDVFTTWIPPYEGTFYVQLTARDKAGNVAANRKRVSWGQTSASIANLYKSFDLFSPNGDGIRETVELHYTVLEPAHLEFNVYDSTGNMVRTFNKDHAAAEPGYISWDGKDEYGNIVSDGKYTIKVFDYEFFVEVDNTSPDVGLALSPIMQNADSLKLYVDLSGHAVDKNIKAWVVEYGEGDNPVEWYTFTRGEAPLVKKDKNGNPLLNPVQDTTAVMPVEADIAFLVRKKFRLTAEDYAGNKSTSIANYLEEKIILDKYRAGNVSRVIPLSKPDLIYSELASPGQYAIGGLETIRSPLVSLNVQYRSSRQWVDGPVIMNPGRGVIDLEWDNIASGFANAIRIKAVDIQGKEYYSNAILIEQLFLINACILQGVNFLYEDLKTLKLQIQSNQDARYSQWTDYHVFNDPVVPVGRFDISGFSDRHLEMAYSFKMTGIDRSGREYQSNIISDHDPECATSPSPASIKISLDINYQEEGCGLQSKKATIDATFSSMSNAALKTLRYYIQKPEGLQLLRNIDLTTEAWGGVALDTSDLAEGNYPVKAVLTYIDLKDDTAKETSLSGTLVVDHELPVARINYPDNAAMLCRVKMTDVQGDWYGIHVEGQATDNNQVKRYELYYGIGENPSAWPPAVTRTGGQSKAIAGEGAKQGELGAWVVTGLNDAPLSLKLKVIDASGNASCTTTSFSIDSLTEITSVNADRTLFSPNGDGTLDDVTLSYRIDEHATTGVKVYKLIKTNGSEILDSVPVSMIASGVQHLGGTGSAIWNGRGESGIAVADGRYGIVISAADSCGNTTQKWTAVEVDNTRPVTAISYPRPGDPLVNIVEVKGTAEDLHFQGFALEAGQGDTPASWTTISSGTAPITDGILGTWNTYGLTGKWTLRLTVTDTVGNKNETLVSIDLEARQNLIKALDVAPKLFSPNNDGKLDTATVSYELTDVCDVKIDILDWGGAVKQTLTAAAVPAGSHSQVWDGKDGAGMPVADALYNVRLTAALSSNTTVNRTEAVSVTVDSTLPAIDIVQPVNNAFIKANVTVNGSITDQNLQEYVMTYSGGTGATSIDQGSQPRSNYTFGTLTDLAEGAYTLIVKSMDLVENSADKMITFTIDRTPPVVKLDAPKDGEYYGVDKNVINISGSIVEKNLETYSLRYGSGDNPAQWTDLVTGTTATAYPSPFVWKVGKNDGIPDGLYTLSLLAKDKAGLTDETRVKVTVDNTPPTVVITSLHDGDYIEQPVDIKGTAFDQNLDNYLVEVSEGRCDTAYKWAPVRKATVSVQAGTLATWQPLPADGDYCLRTTALDKAGNTATAGINVKIDTHPPAAPSLGASVESTTTAHLTWTSNAETDMAGYAVYRDSQRLNTELTMSTSYLDVNLEDGTHAYTVHAVNAAGLDSGPSNTASVHIDSTAPAAVIKAPVGGARISGLIDIKGTAYSVDDFKQYRLFIGQGATPSTWTLIRTSPVPIPYGVLAQWDTLGLAEGEVYSVRLEAEDLTGNVNAARIAVTIDNTAPAVPLLISANAVVSDVTVTWRANTEADFAGYLLYRNDQLANASGTVVGNLNPYLMQVTTYTDKALPDGTCTYSLVAVDRAGNVSDQSNTLSVTIDTHPPHAIIVDPATGITFDNKIMVRADSPDQDISTVQFQYQKSQTSTWTNLGAPLTSSPYTVKFDPASLGLTYGSYLLRAVATDKGQRTDPSPGSITVTYNDLTPPAPPQGVAALTNGNKVSLAWTANTKGDLAGYNIYRTAGTTRSKITASPVAPSPQPGYANTGVADGTYAYDVTAVDTHGNESKASNSTAAVVYAPVLAQPYTPVSQPTATVSGNKAAANAVVSILANTASGLVSLGSVTADASGNFAASAPLSPGENRIFARVTDSAGNVSRDSNLVVVVYAAAPAAPTGLAASVQNYDVQLAWNPNAEPDLAEYNIYRDGIRLNMPVSLQSGTASASSSYYGTSYAASYAVDGNSSTYWLSSYSYGTFSPAWWEIDLAVPELMNRLEIHWAGDSDTVKDYEIQGWSGYAWITLRKITGNNVKDNTVDLKPSYRTNKLRIYITDVTNTSYYKQVGINEVKIIKDALVTGTSFTDPGLRDGRYRYTVTAVGYYGFESAPSDGNSTVVGDVAAPAPPLNLTAAATGSSIILNWSLNAEPDLAGYNLYRNGAQGWQKINSSLIGGGNSTYTDDDLTNGDYTYRLTAVDIVGNESLPSDQASATVLVALPEAPENVAASAVTEGKALIVSWQAVSGPIAGYNIYRSNTSGGPYAKINSSLLAGTSSVDAGLVNGTAYYYVVTAVDLARNESLYSMETQGVPSDTTPLSKPVILSPIRSGGSTTVYTSKTDISGSAKLGSLVELFENDALVGEVATVKKDITQTIAIGSVSDPAVSPDGKTLAYQYSNTVRLMDLATGQATQIISPGSKPVWSANESRIAYGYTDSGGYSRIGLYDVSSGTNAPLTGDSSVYEASPSLSSDGSKIAYISNKGGTYNVWFKDLAAGSAVQVTSGVTSVTNPKLSPDGLRIAYFSYLSSEGLWKLYIYEVSSGTTIVVDNYPNISYVDWSPDGKKIAFISSRTGNYEIFVFDVTKQNLFQFTTSADYEYDPHWSPDGTSITYTKGGSSLWVAPYPAGQSRQIGTGSFNYLTWLQSGNISYIYGSTLYFVSIEAGYFEFKNMALNPGKNAFYAVASDASGNKSAASDPISVTYDTSRTPDLSVTADDIYLYPPYPVAGEQMAVNVMVSNTGYFSAGNVTVDLYIWNANGQMELLHSETIPSLTPGSAALVSAVWDSTGKVGENRLVVVIDPSDAIAEIDESNNMAIKDFVVTANEGVAVTTTLDSAQYHGGQNAGIKITAWNNGVKKDVILETRIEDENGYPVVVFDPNFISLDYGTNQVLDYAWNTGSTYAGFYVVRAILKDASGTTLAENTMTFTIVPDVSLDLNVTTDKTAYGPGENVVTSFTIKNTGTNYIIPDIQSTVTITNAAGSVLFSDEKGLTNLLPGARVSLSSSWNTGLNLPGEYHAVLDLFRDGQLISTKFVSFTINASVMISGSITAASAVVAAGNQVQTTYTITNSGNVDAVGGMLKVLVIDPETGDASEAFSRQYTVNRGESVTDTAAVSTQGLGLKTYTLVLQYSDTANTKTLASATFIVADMVPPVVTIVSPASGTTYNATIPVIVTATDDAAGLERVEYQTDSGSWKLLPVADPSSGRYATNWEPAFSDNGPHSVDFRATDKAGNTSAPVSVSLIIQMDSIPPVTTITVGEPTYESSGNRYVAAGSAFALSASDNFSGVAKTEYQLDGGSWTAHAGAFALTSYGDGKHIIHYRSTDNAGNEESVKELTIIKDTLSPLTTISASAPLIDGVINTVSHITTFTLSAEDALSGVRTVAYRIDEGQWQAYTGGFSLAGLGAGQHVIAFKATDNVLNEEAEQSITVQLVVVEVEKKVVVDPMVLVGLWSDNSALEQKQADINNLNALLSSAGMTYTIALNMDQFTAALRSGRYNTYILIDVKEPLIGEEVREAVYFGNGLVFIKTRQDADPFIDDVFGVKLTGKTTSPDLEVSLVSSPISNEGTLQMAGKAIVASFTTETAQTYGSVTDRQEAIPVVIANQYGRGRAILYTFDLLHAPDHAQASALLVGSLNQVRPAEHYVRALDSVPVRTGLTSLAAPVDVKVVDIIPDTTTADTILPQAALQNNTITWSSTLSPDRKTTFTYYLNLPDRAGSYTINTQLKFKNGADYLPYGDYSLTLMVPYDSAGLLQEMLSELNSITPMNTLDGNGIAKAISDLSTVDNCAATLKETEQNIHAIIAASNEVRGLSVDTTALRLKLDELLKIWEKKWYLLQLQE